MRQYQPIWDRVKQEGKATLVAPVSSHRRIIQAVRKEKCKDDGWRLLCSEKGVRLSLQDATEVAVDADSGSITFSLVDVTGITLADL